MFELFYGWAKGLESGIASIINSFKDIILVLIDLNITSVSGIATKGVQAAAVSLTSLFLIMEIFSQMTSKWFERIEDAIQLWIKLVVAKIIIENSDSIIGGIYEFFRETGKASITNGLTIAANNINGITGLDSIGDPDTLGLVYLLACIILLFIIVIVIVIMVRITIEVMGIVFEIGIHQAVGPIALSTLCNSTFRSTGLSFIKSYTAVCLQTTVIGAIFKVYTAFASKLTSAALVSGFADTGVFGIIFAYVCPILGLTVLDVTIKKSSDITKRLFGA